MKTESRQLQSELRQLQQGINKIMTVLDDEFAAIKASQADTVIKIAAVAADVTALLAKIGSVPPAGLTADQQTALDDIKTAAQAINDSLAAVDASANPPAPPAA